MIVTDPSTVHVVRIVLTVLSLFVAIFASTRVILPTDILIRAGSFTMMVLFYATAVQQFSLYDVAIRWGVIPVFAAQMLGLGYCALLIRSWRR